MPRNLPDTTKSFTPLQTTLNRGKTLWRIHNKSFAADAFNPTLPGPLSGGRFDSQNGSYAYLYAGSDMEASVAEILLRDRPPSDSVYQVLRKKLEGRMLSVLKLSTDIKVAKLHGDGPSHIGQEDDWITSCGPLEYPVTRPWAEAIRGWSLDTCGIAYRPRHDNDRFSYVFFEDRCPANLFEVLTTHPIDEPGPGFSLVQSALARYNAIALL